MALSLDSIQTPQPAEVVITFDGDDLTVTYDRAAFTSAMVEGMFQTPIRTRLGLVLLGWDLLKDGTPWQPPLLSDATWQTRAEARRLVGARMAKDSALGQPDEQVDLTDDERADVLAVPGSAAERRAAYAAAWDAIFVLLPRDFLKAVDAGVLDDFLGQGWRT